MAGGLYLLIAVASGLISGFVGRSKGSSFPLWFLIGGALPVIGLVAALLYRSEAEEPERACPNCGYVQKLYVQVCRRCGEDLYMPDAEAIRRP